jgi:peptidyl-tRNA hydrolase, PTH1 family
VGYLVADELASRMSAGWKPHKSGRTLAIEGRLAGTPGVRAVLGRGRCYMNESGGPVSGLLTFYKADPEQLIVIHDELDIPYGELRTKLGGGDNGHNGLKSIRKSLGTGEFYRVRVGIGRPPGREDTSDFVLKPFSPTERRELDLHVNRAADAVESLITDGLDRTQSLFNR